MVNRQTSLTIRQTHRYLGIFLGIQFLIWTISGLYFSWTDIDEIHGDQFKHIPFEPIAFPDLLGSSGLQTESPVFSLQLMEIGGKPYYWVNNAELYDAETGQKREGVTAEEALQVAGRHMKSDLKVRDIRLLKEAGNHHEYRGRPLPVYEITYKDPENLKAYVAATNGSFQTVRHRNWRWYDFLWMTHTMDYDTRDNFNTFVLRAFSLLGLITVMSGFLLWFISSGSVKKILKNLTK